MPRFPLRRVLLYQSLKMIENKGPPTGKPLSQKESLSIKHAAPLQDAGVTARRQLDFTAGRRPGPDLLEGSARLLPASEHVSPLRNTAVWCR